MIANPPFDPRADRILLHRAGKDGNVVEVGDLHVAQDLEFERREWRVQLVGQLVMLGIVIVALLGFFGAGPSALRRFETRPGTCM